MVPRLDGPRPHTANRSRFDRLTATRVALAAAVGTITWATFAFGAVYDWAHPVVIVGCTVAGLAALAAAGTEWLTAHPRLPIALLGVSLAAGVQLLPLPMSFVRAIDPAGARIIEQYQLNVGASHALTISWSATLLGCAFFAALSLMLIGLAGLFSKLSTAGLTAIVQALLGIGVVLTLVGVIQRATFNGQIYGFWQPWYSGQPFGPFMNRNHFAGWMLMTLPLGTAYAWTLLGAADPGRRRGWRSRILWLASLDANRLTITLVSLLAMNIALFMTMSRSGLSSYAVGLVMMGYLLKRRRIGTSAVRLAVVCTAAFAVAGALYAGVDAVAARFGDIPGSQLGGRIGPWSDAAGIIHDFPLTGTGLNTFGVATLFYQHHDRHAHYQEAHNDYLQLASEGGVLLGIPVLIAAVVFGGEVGRRITRGDPDLLRRNLRFGALVGILCACLQDVSEFSLQMPADAVLFALLCALAIHAPARSVEDPAA